jgi:hypothetical protein
MSALALPLAHPSVGATPTSPGWDGGPGSLYSGLPGLDYTLGGIAPNELSYVVGPACMGKTLLLLELAARISIRYRQNVLFYSVHKPSVYLASKVQLRGDAPVLFANESVNIAPRSSTRTDRAAIHLVDSNSVTLEQVYQLAGRLRGESAGCAILIMDGFCSYREHLFRFEIVDGIAHYPAERWPHALMSREMLANAERFSLASGIPIVVGVTTASLMDDEALAQSHPLESEIRRSADRWVVLHRPEIYRISSERQDSERCLVCSTGTRPSWWDTRCSKLRFDPGLLRFSTVV